VERCQRGARFAGVDAQAVSQGSGGHGIGNVVTQDSSPRRRQIGDGNDRMDGAAPSRTSRGSSLSSRPECHAPIGEMPPYCSGEHGRARRGKVADEIAT
jgi:hypothetical protein